MYKIATLNKISEVGLSTFGENYQITDDLKGATGVIVRSADMHDLTFSDDLLAIARAGAGYNNIPTDRCAEEGIVAFNTPGANANAVKELVLAGMFLSARNIPSGISWASTLSEDVKKTVEKGKSQFAGNEISGKTLGIIGLGAIGVMVANAANSLGMNVVGYDPFMTLRAAHALSNNIEVTADMKALLPKCDYISLHLPVTDETKEMFNSSLLSQMKDNAVLLNFARDTLVNDEDLLKAINTGKIKSYVTDFPNDKVINQEGVIAIPHLGASTEEAEDNCASMAAAQLMDYIENGNIVNSVNYPNCTLGPMSSSASARISILNKNIPSVLGQITGIMSDLNVNIRDLTNKSHNEFASTLLDIEGEFNEDKLLEALSFDGIIKVRILK